MSQCVGQLVSNSDFFVCKTDNHLLNSFVAAHLNNIYTTTECEIKCTYSFQFNEIIKFINKTDS